MKKDKPILKKPEANPVYLPKGKDFLCSGVVSMTDCTGIPPAMPVDEEEALALRDLEGEGKLPAKKRTFPRR